MNTIPRPKASGAVEASAFPSGDVAVRVPGFVAPIMIPAEIARAVADAVERERRARGEPLTVELISGVEPCCAPA